MVVRYRIPDHWIRYSGNKLLNELIDAKASVQSLVSTPFLRSWAEQLQVIQLKMEVAGTSRIEGAEFTERELDAALRSDTAHEAMSRSQRQARAAINTYRWIAQLPSDRPIDGPFVQEIHRRIVTGCDDDHCPPGQLRASGENVLFGTPSHRGVDGGLECTQAFQRLCDAIQREFRGHDLLIQALALHYHIGAMHPFLDGNGRTARALEALVLQRAGLKDELFIAMSNYYYEEKTGYLHALSQSAANGHDITPFLVFALKGIAAQCRRLSAQIGIHVRKMMFKDVMYQMFNRLRSTRKRVIAKRQVEILSVLLEHQPLKHSELLARLGGIYKLKGPNLGLARDLGYLCALGAVEPLGEVPSADPTFAIRLDWPTEITESEFFSRMKNLPKGKAYGFLK